MSHFFFAKKGWSDILKAMGKPQLTDRQKKAQEIASNPSDFKVCEGCDSIVGLSVTVCPNCHAYRFDSSKARVVDQAIYLGARKQYSVTSEDLK